MQMQKLKPDNLDSILKEVVRAIRQGEVIICPTDTVYGLICNAKNKRAVLRIFKIKKRPLSKPIGVFVRDIKAAKELARLNKKQEKFLATYWPGPLTAVLRAKIELPGITFQKTLGIRVPKYKFIWQLLDRLKGPLAQTSANISGKPPSTKIKKVLAQFQGQKLGLDLVIDAGNLERVLPSTVVELTSEKIKILRKGEIKIKK